MRTVFYAIVSSFCSLPQCNSQRERKRWEHCVLSERVFACVLEVREKAEDSESKGNTSEKTASTCNKTDTKRSGWEETG